MHEESDATFGCPVQPVVKEDSESGYRFCNDYTPINGSVVTTPYPLPAISVILLSLALAMFFARLDLKTGYWQFPVHASAKQFLSFLRWGGCTRTMWYRWVLCNRHFMYNGACTRCFQNILAVSYSSIWTILLSMLQHGQNIYFY